MAATTHIRFGDEVLLYGSKSPYGTSGKSIRGGLELDVERDLVKCHGCGNFFKALTTQHLRKCSGLTAREYKLLHGLSTNSSLICESTRALYSEKAFRLIAEGKLNRGNSENCTGSPKGSKKAAAFENLMERCPAQMRMKVEPVIRHFGRMPTRREFEEFGISSPSIKHAFGSFAGVAKVFGLRARRATERTCGWTAETVKSAIRNFIEIHGRIPNKGSSDWRRSLGLPATATVMRYFGTLSAGIKAAGYVPRPSGCMIPWPVMKIGARRR